MDVEKLLYQIMIFIEIDISAYHPSLAAHLVDYKFDTDDIHKSFAEMYGVDYKKSKEAYFQTALWRCF